MARLLDLDAQFLRFERRSTGDVYVQVGHSLAEANGVRFGCPKCFAANGNTMVGTHQVICWSRSRGVPEDAGPGPGRWKMDGTGLHDLTLNADPPETARSVKLNGGCEWHGHVTNGEAV